MTKAYLNLACAVLFGITLTIANAEDSPQLTLQEAHQAALRSHPEISVADLKALAARQVTRQFRSGFFPTLSANAVAVGAANDNTRLSAIGALNNPSIFDRNAEGPREQILLAVDGAFFAGQQAQSVTRVAEQTVAERQVFLDQVSVMATNKLRSELDVSFARVNVEDGKLLLSKAQNDVQASFAQLANLMGLREQKTYRLVEQPLPPELSTNISDFVQLALRSRPDLLSLRNSEEATFKFSRAERALHYPTLSAVGSAGVVPIGNSALGDNYAAAGLILTVPLYAGGLYSARQQEAELRSQAAEESLRDLENNVVRDVRVAWLNAQNAFDRLRITSQLLDN